MRYVPLITNLTNETVINIYYIHYHLHIIIYLLHIIKKMNQTSNHMDTKIFTWKPSHLGENHRSFTNFKIYFARIKHWLGQQPLTIYLKENKDSYDTIYFLVSLRGSPTPYKPTVQALAPPYHPEMINEKERLKTDSVQALQTTINVTDSSEKLT